MNQTAPSAARRARSPRSHAADHADPPPDGASLLPPHLLVPVFMASLGCVVVWAVVSVFSPALHHLLPYHAAAIVVIALSVLLAKKGYPRGGAGLFTLSIWVLVQLPPFVNGRLDVPGILLPLIAVLAAGLIWSTHAAMGLAGLSSLVWLAGLWASQHHSLTVHARRSDFQFWLILTESLVMVSVFLHVATRALKEALAQARGSALQTSRLMQHAPDAIVIVDREGSIRSANPVLEAITGIPTETVLGGPVLRPDLLSDEDIKAAHAAMESSFRGERSDPLELEILRPDGETVTVEATSHRVAWNGRPCLEIIIRDITARRRTEQDRLDLVEQTTLLQKMEAVGQLAGGVAHDFNNLLTVMGGCADLIGEDPEASDSIIELAGEIRTAQEQASVLTRRLLAFAQRLVVDPRPLSLGTHVAARLELIRGVVGDAVTVELRAPAVDSTVMADVHELEQILINLASNARDAMGGSGTLRIDVDVQDLAEELDGAAGTVSPGRYAVLQVSDDGEGIEPDHMARIFDPFFTTKKGSGGSGLGLSAVLGIVRMGGGQVRVRSRLGEGTTVSVYLPCVEV